MSDFPKIVSLDASMAAATNEHMLRHMAESGRYGVHWLPYEPDSLAEPPSVNVRALDYPFHKPGWERWFVVLGGPTEVVGHLSLDGYRYNRIAHRCLLGMGLEHHYWRRGLGSKLLQRAIDCAHSAEGIAWLDLRVLGCNGPALALYRKHGFQELSRVPDYARIDGLAIDDVFMTLSVG